MNLLLDTHIWLWSLLEPERLSARARGALSSSESTLWLSPISAWEVLILAERGRLSLELDGQAWLDRALRAAPMREAPLTHEIARESRRLDLPHQDPADRFIVATAKVLGLTLLTADQALLEYADVPTFPGR